jgi:hypothetical protein
MSARRVAPGPSPAPSFAAKTEKPVSETHQVFQSPPRGSQETITRGALALPVYLEDAVGSAV